MCHSGPVPHGVAVPGKPAIAVQGKIEARHALGDRMRLDVAGVPEGGRVERLCLRKCASCRKPRHGGSLRPGRQHGVPIQLVLVAAVADRLGLEKQSAALLDVAASAAPPRRPLLVFRVEAGSPSWVVARWTT